MISTAVVILNYNGEKLLRQFLPSVIQFSNGADIIVADNGSTDQSTTILTNEFPQVRLISLDKNYGFCGGYNKALKQVDAKYFVLLNSDIEVTPNWLAPLTSLLEQNIEIAAVQPKILSYHRRNKFEYAGAGGGYIDALGYPFCRGRVFDYVETDTGQYNDLTQTFWASGACLLIRSETYFKFGGLDKDFFAHMEEIDLCWKINRTDQKVYYCGQSTVYHVGAGTLDYANPRKTYLNFRNGLTLIAKHFDTLEMAYKIPLRLALDWVALFLFLSKGQGRNGLSVLKAHLHFFSQIQSILSKRKQIRDRYPTYSRKSVYQGSVVIDYYLKGKKIFNNPR
jgi:GT2 family glycosyltransferase